MSDPLYAMHTPRQLKAKHDRILAIVKADPGIGLDEISKIYHGDNPVRPIAKRRSLANLVLVLCSNNQLTYIKGVQGYVAT